MCNGCPFARSPQPTRTLTLRSLNGTLFLLFLQKQALYYCPIRPPIVKRVTNLNLILDNASKLLQWNGNEYCERRKFNWTATNPGKQFPFSVIIFVVSRNKKNVKISQNGFGELDEQVWKEKFAPFIENEGQIKNHSICDSPFLNAEEKIHYRELIESAGILNQDPVLFRLNILLTMTKPYHRTPEMFVHKVYNRYEILMLRRLKHLEGLKKSPFSELVSQVVTY